MFVFQMSNGKKLPDTEVKNDYGKKFPLTEMKPDKGQVKPAEDHLEIIGSREFCSRCYTILCPTQFSLNLTTYNLTGYCAGCDLKITFLARKRKWSGSDSDYYEGPITRSRSKYM